MDTEIDTEGILDRCAECGERARFTTGTIADIPAYGVECSECANAIMFGHPKDQAMVIWNQAQRQAGKRQCSLSLECKSETCLHAKPHDAVGGCTRPAPCGNWPGKPDFQPRVWCRPSKDVKPRPDCPECGAKESKGHHYMDCIGRLKRDRAYAMEALSLCLQYHMSHEPYGDGRTVEDICQAILVPITPNPEPRTHLP
jgi:hypothetical protein